MVTVPSSMIPRATLKVQVPNRRRSDSGLVSLRCRNTNNIPKPAPGTMARMGSVSMPSLASSFEAVDDRQDGGQGQGHAGQIHPVGLGVAVLGQQQSGQGQHR